MDDRGNGLNGSDTYRYDSMIASSCHGRGRANPRIALFFVVTEDWYFHLHWLNLAADLAAGCFDVTVVTRVSDHGAAIRARGLRVVQLNIPRSLRYPWRDVLALVALVRLYRQERPQVIHHLALKPVMLGTLAAYLVSAPIVVNSLPGLGYIYSSPQRLARLLRPIVSTALRWLNGRLATWTVFQNADDLAVMRHARVVSARSSSVIRGTGVDLTRFRPASSPSEPCVVIVASRLLWDKGIGEFVSAARKLRQSGSSARFVLVGDVDVDNPLSVPGEKLTRWQQEGVIEWWGRRNDMPNVFAAAHVVCLPSYREGLPTVLLEAAACGLPIVTTNAPGCREVVNDGLNGLLVPVRDVVALAAAIDKLVGDKLLRESMGAAGRQLVMECFSRERVVNETAALYDMLVKRQQEACRD